MGPVFFLAAFPVALCAQTQQSLGAGVGTVRYAGGSSFSAATLSPALQVVAPSFYLGAAGSLSMLKDGVWAGQARTDVWAAFPRHRVTGTRIALNVNAAASTRSDGVATGAASAIAELVWTSARGGAAIGAGPTTGLIEGASSITAPHLRARGWRLVGPTQVSVTLEPVRFAGAWYTDLGGGVTLDRGRTLATLWAGARISSAYGSKGAASAALQYFVSPTVALEGSAGIYLSDPFQGLPRIGFVSAGVRVHATPRMIVTAQQLPPRLAPLIPPRRGDSVVVRFRMDAQRSVAIAGDWNSWQPFPLRSLGGDIWEGALILGPGTYHFNLLVDGTEWVVPGGVATVPDGMGGLVAVLTVL